MSLFIIGLLLVILYTYFGYFFGVVLLGQIFKKKVLKKDIEPEVTLLVAAFNEEKGIAKKIENSLALDYPKQKLKIIVVSDGSTDLTDEIVKSFSSSGVELFRVEGRVGKTEARNIAMKSVPGEIIIFSDATTTYQSDIVRKIVRNFADKTVGMVTGHLIYRDENNTQMGIGQKLFWKYESLIKKSQTSLGTLTGSVGCVTAFRKELYTPLPSNIIEDFTGPLMLVMKGFRVVYEEEALCFEETTKKVTNEWHMRIRVIRGGMTGMLYARKILNPIDYTSASFQLISHKILRWIVPILLIVLVLVNLFAVLEQPENHFNNMLLYLQILFYLVALGAFLLERRGVHSRLAAIPLYFVILNAASFVALYKTLTTRLEATWDTNRES